MEEMMVASVRKVLGESYAAYGDTARNMWVLEWPGQTVICTSSIYWTAEVSDAMKTSSGVEVIVIEIFRYHGYYAFCCAMDATSAIMGLGICAESKFFWE